MEGIGHRFVASPGCSLPDDVSDEVITALLTAVTTANEE
jgi:hypothetical protein